MPTNKETNEKLSRQGKRAKRKGGNYERSLAKRFQDQYGVELKRTPQSGGFAKKSDKADDYRGDITIVDTTKILLLHIEAKNQKTLKIHEWIEQAKSDCPLGRIPIVIFHVHGTSKDYVIVSFDEFFYLSSGQKILEKELKFLDRCDRKKLSILKWIDESKSDIDLEDVAPVVEFTHNEKDYCVLSLNDFLKIIPKNKVIGKRKFQ